MVLAHRRQGEWNLQRIVREGGDHDQAVHTWIANEATSTRNFGKVRSNRGSVDLDSDSGAEYFKLTGSLKKLGHRATDHSD